jgi:hypothetical protein
LFAGYLLNSAVTEKLNTWGLNTINEALPRHLKTFAMKVGSSNSFQIYRDVMVSVRKHKMLELL